MTQVLTVFPGNFTFLPVLDRPFTGEQKKADDTSQVELKTNARASKDKTTSKDEAKVVPNKKSEEKLGKKSSVVPNVNSNTDTKR